MNNDFMQKYQQLINQRKTQPLNKDDYEKGYVETHHIIPKCIGGDDSSDNLINLFAKEHFIAHYLLWKAYEDEEIGDKFNCAVIMMAKGTKHGCRKDFRDYIIASEEYHEARVSFAKYLSQSMPSKVSGQNNGNYGKHWYYDPDTKRSKIFAEGEQPDGWKRGMYVTDEQKKNYKSHIGDVWIYNVATGKNTLIEKDKATLLVQSGEWRYGHTQRKMSDEAKARLKAIHSKIPVSDAFRYVMKGKEAYIKGKHKYINIKTNQIKYFSKDEEIPEDFVPTSTFNKKRIRHAQRRQQTHDEWIKQTQEMADYYVDYGYEATCKKFDVHMSVESMLMRFIRARKLYGIKFESMRTAGRKRTFKKLDENKDNS